MKPMRTRKNNGTSYHHHISLMGSTGSIGRQTLDIVRRFPDKFKIEALTANKHWEELARQALEFRPRTVVIADSSFRDQLADALTDTGIEVLSGEEGLTAAAILPESDLVVAALVGYSGLPSTVAALEAGKTVALANKETLVVAGEIIEELVKRNGKRIIPVDSEHSAIFQCLWGENPASVSKLILTASGGPFRNFSKEQLQKVTVKQALSHPNWEMGAKVTIDSATMMNKGFEMIEARWLFGMSPSDIRIVVHPESIIHSMVEFVDGSVKAQMSQPDMHLPIAVALGFPNRLNLENHILNLSHIGKLTFEDPDLLKFPLLGLAYAAAEAGGIVPAIMNAANETAVAAFLNGEISFTDISSIVIATVNATKGNYKNMTVSLDSIAQAHTEGTEIAREYIYKRNT